MVPTEVWIKERTRIHYYTRLDVENNGEIYEDTLVAHDCCIIDSDHSFEDMNTMINAYHKIVLRS